MLPSERDTIFALSSAPGRGGVAIIRISGPRANAGIEQLLSGPPLKERRAVVRTVFDPSTNVRIDDAVVLRFGSPASYTGEDVVEIQCHGGRAVVGALLECLGHLNGFRLADAGEFTRRAVENGRMDLTQAEAVADLIEAETEGQRQQAFCQFEGHLATMYDNWRARLIRASAWIEASIDFPDEEIPPQALIDCRREVNAVRDEIRAHLADGRRGEILRDGFHIAVIGAPNVGKSSIINMLAQREAAIVTAIPGTTRDIIEVRLDLRGYPIILSDTAGIREAEDEIEREGVRRARARAKSAQARLLVLDATRAEIAEDGTADMIGGDDIVVWNKIDLAIERPKGTCLSARTGEGVAELVGKLADLAERNLAGEGAVVTRSRHRLGLQDAALGLEAALEAGGRGPEIVADEVRRALDAIGRVTGRVDLEEVLDSVFKDFCIGK